MQRKVISIGSPNYRLKKMARLCADRRRVLDVGWAAWPNVYMRNAEVIGLDLQKGLLPKNYTSCVVGDVMTLPEPFEPDSFDALAAGEIIEHLESPLDFLRRCYKTLKPGGLLVLSTPNPFFPAELLLTITLSRRYYYTQEHVCLYPQRWLIRLMERAGFTDVKLYSGGVPAPILGGIPFPRTWCYETIATGEK